MTGGLRIPIDLLPGDGRFGSGPTKVRPEAVQGLIDAAPTYLGTSHRRPAVKGTVARIRSGLSALFALPAGYEVALGLGGATAFWDAAAFGLIDHRSEHLSFGEFSSKFAAVVGAAPHLAEPVVIASPHGTHPEVVVDERVDVYAFTHNETSTGVTMPIERPDAEGLVVVDGTSAAGAVRVNPSQFDVYYFSPQKAFGSDGGIWVALLSPAAVRRIEAVKASGRYLPAFLDLSIALENSRKDQTYNTPALVTLFLLEAQINWFNEQGGLAWSAAASGRNADLLYRWAERTPYTSPFVDLPEQRSPVTATIDFTDEVDAGTVASVLRSNGILDVEPYRKLGRNQLRIGLWPAIPASDVEALTACIDHVVGALT
jgi:phosphoserine aminotransferase